MLEQKIIDILEEWNISCGDFDGCWHGYDSLKDKLQEKGFFVTKKQMSKVMKFLSKIEKVELRPTFTIDNDGKYILNGRGWFINERIK